jgi:pimeloyl-ACP methyl ester carboxylesterase
MDGYSLQDFRFATKDQQEVHLWRIRRQDPPPDKPYPVVILHGLLESASTWFLTADK